MASIDNIHLPGKWLVWIRPLTHIALIKIDVGVMLMNKSKLRVVLTRSLVSLCQASPKLPPIS